MTLCLGWEGFGGGVVILVPPWKCKCKMHVLLQSRRTALEDGVKDVCVCVGWGSFFVCGVHASHIEARFIQVPCMLLALAGQKYSHTVARMNSEPLVASLPWHEIKIPQWDGCRGEWSCFPSTAISLPSVLNCNWAMEAKSNRKRATVEIIWRLIVQSQTYHQNYIKSIIGQLISCNVEKKLCVLALWWISIFIHPVEKTCVNRQCFK